ncbi:hypothetical protein [Rhizobium phage RHEph12]|nr:hypothetical protein [Rhizobium phage RHEph12]
MNLKRSLTIAALASGLAACGNDAMETTYSANGAKADKIAVIEGCNLYRVYDGNLAVYTTICPHSNSVTQSSHNCGKGCEQKDFSMTAYKE